MTQCLRHRGCNDGKTGASAEGCLYADRSLERSLGAKGDDPKARRVLPDKAKALQLVEAGLRLEPTHVELLAMKQRLSQ
jgi:hypothetical protein